MVKLLKKNKTAKADKNKKAGSKDGKKPAQGISAAGNAMRDALVQGLAVALIPVVIAAAYLYTIRAPEQKGTLVGMVAENYATQQARVVSQAVNGLRARVKSASQSPEAMAALEALETPDLAGVEQAMLSFFPDAVSLRLSLLGRQKHHVRAHPLEALLVVEARLLLLPLVGDLVVDWTVDWVVDRVVDWVPPVIEDLMLAAHVTKHKLRRLPSRSAYTRSPCGTPGESHTRRNRSA